ncbi:winged helix-turn-helix domain-containing protein [Tistrella mobilis]|uniref:Uncharacterized protein n=1 Tax=Tistrella mobilis (strain KA081020-065) TaxID=1110502 RepID=I3TNA1_TISMK|nr:winged helix-turn-helix domain-containing protein [Tistrella mobilis]AFK54239.1 phage-related conserved putative protein [Tistrella mobilis KA081020-065]
MAKKKASPAQIVQIPATLPEQGGANPRHQALWRRILGVIAEGGDITVNAIAGGDGGSRSTAQVYLRRLAKAGILRELRRDGTAVVYGAPEAAELSPAAPAVRPDGTVQPPSAARANMWRTLQMTKAVTTRDLAIWASTEAAPVTLRAAQAYCVALTAAGLAAKRGSGAQAVYVLLPGAVTGPRAPVVVDVRAVIDPNTGRAVGVAPAREVPLG